MDNIVQCLLCHKRPHELSEYINVAADEGITPEAYVRREEGTFNPRQNVFYCTPCYIKAGMPLGRAEDLDTAPLCDELDEES